MIEELLREAFARQETAVPDAARLVPAIDAEARRRRGRRRTTRSAAVAVALILTVAGIPVLGRTWLADRSGGSTAAVPDSPVPERSLNFLIVGLDRLPTWPPDHPATADAIVIAHVPRDRSAVFLLSVPRDLRVASGSATAGADGARIGHTYMLGGFAGLARTVTQLTGVGFDGGATIELDGLAGLVDELGGVRFCIDRPVRSIHTGRTFATGCAQLTGAQARDLLRQRKDYPHGSVARSWYLARFFGAMLRQVASPETLRSLDRLRAVVGTVRRHAEVDTRGIDPVDLVWDLRRAAGTVVDLGVPVRLGPPGRGLVVEATRDAEGLFDALRRDTVAAWVAANPDRGERVEE
jgi:LCP family protein required for cell wall assembly